MEESPEGDTSHLSLCLFIHSAWGMQGGEKSYQFQVQMEKLAVYSQASFSSFSCVDKPYR